MSLAFADIIDWLATVCGKTPDDVKLWLWIGLLAGVLAATVQFILMMVTRWGNSDPTGKALMCSVLLHLSLTSGAVVVSPPKQVVLALTRKEKPPRTDVRNIVVEGQESVPNPQGGNTPVWEKPPEKPSTELARLDKAPMEMTPLQGPDRKPEELTRPELDLPELPHLPEMPVARPEIEKSAEVGPKLESAAPAKIEDATVEARPDVSVPTTSVVRRQATRSGVSDIAVDRLPSRGGVDQVIPMPQVEPPREVASITLPSNPALAPVPMVTVPDATDRVQRRRGPAPSEVPDSTGSVAETKTNDAATGAVGKPKFERLRTRTPKMEDFGGTQRLQPDKTPTTPNPEPGPIVSVREGVASASPVDGIRPNAIRPNVAPINRNTLSNLPPTYRLRNLAKRAETARQFGGTDASERTVESSLKWLALHQSPEGNWDADGFHLMCPDNDQCRGRGAGRELDEAANERPAGFSQADAGVTGLVVLAFLGAGYTHEEGPYADQVDRALSWLIRHQRADGYLGANAARFEQMYSHAIATYAMAEALGMQADRTDKRLRVPLQKALAYIASQQNRTDGGWRYEKGQSSDMSMFGWQLMALKSGEIAGIPMPEETRQLMILFLKERSLGPRKGLATYRVLGPMYPPLPPTMAMTAEALFCKQMLGISRTNPQSVEAIEFLMERLPNRANDDIYAWYYGTLAVYQFGGDEWLRWNGAMREYLISEQRRTGHAAGSWDPKPPWGTYGGRVFQTALSALSLEVYYRFLPLYQVQKGEGGL